MVVATIDRIKERSRRKRRKKQIVRKPNLNSASPVRREKVVFSVLAFNSTFHF